MFQIFKMQLKRGQWRPGQHNLHTRRDHVHFTPINDLARLPAQMFSSLKAGIKFCKKTKEKVLKQRSDCSTAVDWATLQAKGTYPPLHSPHCTSLYVMYLPAVSLGLMIFTTCTTREDHADCLPTPSGFHLTTWRRCGAGRPLTCPLFRPK